MASAGLVYDYNDKEAQERLSKAIRQCTDLAPVLDIIAEIGTTSISKNFEEGGRPKWDDLEDSTKARREKVGKWPGQILVVSGALSRISTVIDDNSVTWSPGPEAEDYAAIHQFGGETGRDKKTKIPKREYLLWQDNDEIEIHFAVHDHVMEE